MDRDAATGLLGSLVLLALLLLGLTMIVRGVFSGLSKASIDSVEILRQLRERRAIR